MPSTSARYAVACHRRACVLPSLSRPSASSPARCHYLDGPTALTIATSVAPFGTVDTHREALADTLQQRCQRLKFIRGHSGEGRTKPDPDGLNRFFDDRLALLLQASEKIPTIVAGHHGCHQAVALQGRHQPGHRCPCAAQGRHDFLVWHTAAPGSPQQPESLT